MKRTHLIIFVTAGRTKATFAAERNKLHVAAMRASKKSAAMRMVTTMDHFLDIFDDRVSGTDDITDMFIIISKNGL